MRALLSSTGSPEDVELMEGVAARLRALGAEVLVCAPPDHPDPPTGGDVCVDRRPARQVRRGGRRM